MSLLDLKKGLLLLIMMQPCAHALSSLSKNDPFPIYTSLDPHEMLYRRERQKMMGFDVPVRAAERVAFSISPYGQNANSGKDMNKVVTPLGDLGGRYNMIGLLFGETPEGEVVGPFLQDARDTLFPQPKFPVVLGDNEAAFIDVRQNFGFFSIPLKYRRRGLRFEVSAQVCSDFGFTFQTGVADICQTVVSLDTNLTCSATYGCDATTPVTVFPNITACTPCQLNADDVNCKLMTQLCPIAKEIGLDVSSFHKFALEDIRLGMYWRRAYTINDNRNDWPFFLMIPFIRLDGSLGTGKEKDPHEAFGLPFGNNGHSSVGPTFGLNLDFADTVEIGCEFGATHFFPKDFCAFRVPTSKYQSGIYPYATSVRIRPGNNWHFGAKLACYHFIDRLSFYTEYLFVHHEDDRITLRKPDPAFKPEYLENISSWKTQLANVGFNYDISPFIGLGFLWQAPLTQQNTYQTTTIMFSFNVIF